MKFLLLEVCVIVLAIVALATVGVVYQHRPSDTYQVELQKSMVKASSKDSAAAKQQAFDIAIDRWLVRGVSDFDKERPSLILRNHEGTQFRLFFWRSLWAMDLKQEFVFLRPGAALRFDYLGERKENSGDPCFYLRPHIDSLSEDTLRPIPFG